MDKIKGIWQSFSELFPFLKDGHWFVSGMDLVHPLWNKGEIPAQLSFECIYPNVKFDISGFGQVDVSGSGDSVICVFENENYRLNCRVFSNLENYQHWLNHRPLTIHKNSWSFKFSDYYQKECGIEPSDVYTCHQLQSMSELNELVRFCLKYKLQLSGVVRKNHLKPLSYMEVVDSGLLEWIDSFNLIAYFLDDLMTAKYLDEEAVKWLTPLLSALYWWEKNYLEFSNSVKSSLEDRFPKSELKLDFLMQFLDLSCFKLDEDTHCFYMGLKQNQGWLDSQFLLKKIDKDLLLRWIDLFGDNYLYAFMLCGLLYCFRQRKQASELGLSSLIAEIIEEEEFVGTLAEKVSETENWLKNKPYLLHKRWSGELKTSRQLKILLDNQ
jgi:hypothetical protein